MPIVECPHASRKVVGEVALTICTLPLSDKPCLVASGLECEEWGRIQKERRRHDWDAAQTFPNPRLPRLFPGCSVIIHPFAAHADDPREGALGIVQYRARRSKRRWFVKVGDDSYLYMFHRCELERVDA